MSVIDSSEVQTVELCKALEQVGVSTIVSVFSETTHGYQTNAYEILKNIEFSDDPFKQLESKLSLRSHYFPIILRKILGPKIFACNGSLFEQKIVPETFKMIAVICLPEVMDDKTQTKIAACISKHTEAKTPVILCLTTCRIGSDAVQVDICGKQYSAFPLTAIQTQTATYATYTPNQVQNVVDAICK